MVRTFGNFLISLASLVGRMAGAVFVGGAMLLALGLVGLAGLIWIGGTSGIVPDSNARAVAQRQALQATRAARWTNACARVDCSIIPTGYVLGMVGTSQFLLPMPSWQRADLSMPPLAQTDPSGCHLTTHLVPGIRYRDGIAQRGLNLNRANLPLRITCPQTDVVTSIWPRTGGTGRVRYYAGHLWAERRTFNVRYRAYLPGNGWTPPDVTYASRQPMLRAAGGGFDVFVDDDGNHTGLYLSRAPLFQGRHVALVCGSDCEIRTVAFQDDPPLDALHLDFLVQFNKQGLDCAPYQPVWTCGVLPGALPDIASLIRFLDRQITQTRL